MNRVAALSVVLTIGFLSAADVAAQTAANPALASRGRGLFMNRGCAACHGIGKKAAGPDLAGVMQRRSREWLIRFMKQTDEMLASDSTAMALMKEWKGAKMPKTNLNDQDLDAVFAYIDAETAKLKE